MASALRPKLEAISAVRPLMTAPGSWYADSVNASTRRRSAARGWRCTAFVAAIVVSGARGNAWGQGACPAPASVPVFVENLSADSSVTVQLEGELVAAGATCTGSGATTYTVQLTCQGQGVASCGEIPGLRPGQWVNRIRVAVNGSQEQSQAKRQVFAASDRASVNRLVWRVFRRTFVVTDTTATGLRTQLDAAAAFTAANPGPALVTFARATFPGAGSPQRIDLPRGPCPSDPPRASSLCFAGSRVTIDALDDQARPGAVIWSAGTRPISVLRVYGSDDVFRGLVFEGSQTVAPTGQSDAIVFVGATSVRNRLEQSTVIGPTLGDGISIQDDAGGLADPADAVVIDRCELGGAHDRGVIVTNRARAAVRDSCLHDNRGGGLQVTAGGGLTAERNLVQRNLPGSAGKGIAAIGSGAPEASTLVTDGNIVRFEGGRGISVTDHTTATLRNDYVADNQFVGVKIESTAAALPGAGPQASMSGAALVCNRNAGVSGTCQPQAGEEGVPCATDADCCGLPDGCCVSDAQCASPLHCAPPFPVGRGLTIAQAAGTDAPVVALGAVGTPGRNAFTLNRSTATGANLFLNVPNGVSTPLDNQWEHCGDTATCVAGDVLAFDVRLATGAAVDIGMPAGAKVGTPVLAKVLPSRPSAGDVVRIYGEGFNAIDGTACGGANGPVAACDATNAGVQVRNQQTNATRLRIQTADGTVLSSANLQPDAVTPTMIAFRMPFDCFAPLVLQVAKRDPNGNRLTATIPLCDPDGCAGQPDGLPCDDASACTSGDVCSGGACVGTPIACSGQCLTGACDAQTGCVAKASTATCDDGNACTVGDHCNGTGTCVVTGPRVCANACMTGVCDVSLGCLPKPAQTLCRISTGTCDVSEFCDGVSGNCPANGFLGAGTVCRPAVGACDVDEVCTGQTAACPPNALRPALTECRAAAGVCDVAELCTGNSGVCPADLKRTDVCRQSAGVCDAAEQCDGVTDDCPADVMRPATTVCRAATGACDVAEQCDGSDPSCPDDAVAPATTSCSDGTACTAGDHCRGDADVCVAGAALDCSGACLTGVCNPQLGCVTASAGTPCTDDGDACTTDVCRAGGQCTHPALDGVDALTCQVPQCTRPKLRRRIDRLSAQIVEAVHTGKTPKARKLKRLATLLKRCNVGR